MNLLSYRAAAAILRCSHQTVGNLLRSGTLTDLRRETVTALATTYQPRDARTPPRSPGRPRGSTGRSGLAIILPDGRRVWGWHQATTALGCSSRSSLRRRAEWRDGYYVIRPVHASRGRDPWLRIELPDGRVVTGWRAAGAALALPVSTVRGYAVKVGDHYIIIIRERSQP